MFASGKVWRNSVSMSFVRALPKMLSIVPSVLSGIDVRDLERIKAITREAYPSVRQVDTETLAEWMQGNSSLLLIDVRSAEEFGVSHLNGAVNLQERERIAASIKEQRPGKTILYCSVGFRSSRLAQALGDEGLGEVWNLEGSIFEWANEGRPVFQGEMPVQKVHPYGKRWAGLLRAGLASFD